MSFTESAGEDAAEFETDDVAAAIAEDDNDGNAAVELEATATITALEIERISRLSQLEIDEVAERLHSSPSEQSNKAFQKLVASHADRTEWRSHTIDPDAGFLGMSINDEPSDLMVAAIFLNEEVRPRRIEIRPGEWRKLEYGCPGGEMYPICGTSAWDLRDFGLGVAMYFQTLQLLTMTFFISALLQVQTQKYYKSEKYSDGQPNVAWLLVGSAVCTRHEVVCLDPECADQGTRNLCQLGVAQAYFDLANTVMLFLLMFIVGLLQNRVSTILDEKMQTAADYSVFVDDPGHDDTDPDVWRDFFGQFGHVTFITVAKNNGDLLLALAQRRAIMREIIMVIGNGFAPDGSTDWYGETRWQGMLFKEKLADALEQEKLPALTSSEARRRQIANLGFLGMSSLKSLDAKLRKVNAQIQEAVNLTKGRYSPSAIFVTFETEFAQRKCLKALTRGTIPAALEWKGGIPDSHLFKGTNVLMVQKACEPAEVFWNDVDVTFGKRLYQSMLTWIVTILMVVASLIVTKYIRVFFGAKVSAIWIGLSNIIVPEMLRVLCFKVEDHLSLNDQQMSLFFKLTFFRWMNSTICPFLTTDFEATLTEKSIDQIQAVLFADAFTTPAIRTLNPYGAILQRVISRYSLTQEKMNTYYFGSEWYAAERYADMTKTLLLALFSSALYPSGLFMTCVGYAVVYSLNKYNVLRTWNTPAELSDGITKVSRGHLVLGVFAHAFMTMIYFSEFPFDNICEVKDHKTGANLRLKPSVFSKAFSESGVTNQVLFRRCDQVAGLGALKVLFGGVLTRESMSVRQHRVVTWYSWLVCGLSLVLFGAFFGSRFVFCCLSLFKGGYSAKAKLQEDNFSQAEGVQAFIPFIRHPSLAFPLVAADQAQFDPKFLAFEMPDEESYRRQNLFNKEELPGFFDEELAELFSTVRHYPPPEDLVERDDDDDAVYRKVNDEAD
jgi:hypothetical protein